MAKIKLYHFYIVLLFSPLYSFARAEKSTPENTNIPTLRIAVASNFRPTMKKLVPAFLKSHAIIIRWQSASSGAIFNQILHGAPYDLFLSADSERPQKLIQQHHATASSLQTYALGRLVWYEPDKQHPSLLTIKKPPAIITIANPKIAPYGKAAAEVIKKLNHKNINFNKVIVASNILQTFQYVHTGNVTAGFVAYAQIINLKLKNKFWVIPSHWYQPIRQQAVMVQSAHKKQAQQFLDFLQSETARKIIREMGYDLPEKITGLKGNEHDTR